MCVCACVVCTCLMCVCVCVCVCVLACGLYVFSVCVRARACVCFSVCACVICTCLMCGVCVYACVHARARGLTLLPQIIQVVPTNRTAASSLQAYTSNSFRTHGSWGMAERSSRYPAPLTRRHLSSTHAPVLFSN